MASKFKYLLLLISEVLKGLYQGKPVAIKMLKDNNRAAQAFLREASLMT